MTRYNNTFDAGTAAGAATIANLGGLNGRAPDAQGGTGSATYETAAAMHGALGIRTSSASSLIYWEHNVATTAMAARLYFRIGALPGADNHVLRFGNGATRLVSWHINAANKLRLSDASGTTGIWTATDALAINTWYRLELYAVCGSTTSNGVIQGYYYLGDSTTAIGGFTSAAANVGAATSFTRLTWGRQTSSGIVYDYDELAYDDAASALIGPWVAPDVPLPTPAPTWTFTNPTAPGATDGTITGTWADVDGAGSYALSLDGGTTTHQTGVTSPHVVTGLGAGTYAPRIQARP